MNFRGMYNNNKSMLIALTSTVAIDAVLTTLVICQRHDQNAVIDEASIRAAVPMSGARLPAGADIVATPNAMTHPDPAATPHPADALVGSVFPAPGSSTPQAPTTPPPGRSRASDHHTTSTDASCAEIIQTENSDPPARKPAPCTTAAGRNTPATCPDNSHYSSQEARCTTGLLTGWVAYRLVGVASRCAVNCVGVDEGTRKCGALPINVRTKRLKRRPHTVPEHDAATATWPAAEEIYRAMTSVTAGDPRP
jgi:hypothetical protein